MDVSHCGYDRINPRIGFCISATKIIDLMIFSSSYVIQLNKRTLTNPRLVIFRVTLHDRIMLHQIYDHKSKIINL